MNKASTWNFTEGPDYSPSIAVYQALFRPNSSHASFPSQYYVRGSEELTAN